MIGQNIIKSILKYNIEYDGNIQIYALVRNVDKAERIFGLSSYIKYIEGNVIDAEIDCEVDYVFTQQILLPVIRIFLFSISCKILVHILTSNQ